MKFLNMVSALISVDFTGEKAHASSLPKQYLITLFQQPIALLSIIKMNVAFNNRLMATSKK
jgi:hypothetical protein